MLFSHPETFICFEIEDPSGLFITQCFVCGLKMELGPLHLVVMVALQLSIAGRPEEDLFGILATTLCLLVNGANSSQRIHISFSLYREVSNESFCDHEPRTAAEFCWDVINSISDRISPALLAGWRLLHWVLEHSAMEWLNGEIPESRWSCPEVPDPEVEDEFEDAALESVQAHVRAQIPCSIQHTFEKEANGDKWYDALMFSMPNHRLRFLALPDNFFGSNGDLSCLWAAVQTELLTYRRLQEQDPWVSPRFDMSSLLQSLQAGNGVNIRLVSENMMRDHCKCGRFIDAINPMTPVTDDVCEFEFSNLNDSKRTNYIHGYRHEDF
jgi:hypothetical protein